MPLSQNTLNPLLFRPKGFIVQVTGLVAADLTLLPGATRLIMVSDQNAYIGLDRDAVVAVAGVVYDDLLFLGAGSTRTIYVGDVTRLSCIVLVAGSLVMQELGDI